MNDFLRKKPVSLILEQSLESEEKGGLKRSLTGLNLLLLGVGGIIGAGIFVLTGQASAQYAGPAIVLSFILSGIACTFAAFCYAELAAMLPVSGSAYTYAYATLGEFIAWIIGWDLILEYLFGSATVAVGWSGYVKSFLKDIGINIPDYLSSSPYVFSHDTGWTQTGALINLPAVLIVLVSTYILVKGIRESATANNIVVFLKCSVLLLFICAGASYVNIENWTPFIPENTGTFGQYGWSGIVRGAGVIFFAYIGFDSLSTLAQEAKNPQKDMAFGILGALVVCTIFYIAVSLVLTGVVSYTLLNVPDPIAVAVNAAGDGLMWLRPFIKAGAIAGLSSVVLVLLMSQPRIFYSMSRDGLLPPIFSKLHSKYQTPHISTMLCGGLAAIIAGFLPIGILGELVSIGTLFAFVIVCTGVLVLRYTHPDINRPFLTPYPKFVCTAGALMALLQMAFLPLDTWIRLFIWLLLGMIIYFTYSIKNSHLTKQTSKK